MFFHLDIKGDRLPPGTLCLTYDDGPGETVANAPGPHTRALGQYLHDQGIAATFFMIGRHVEQHPGVVSELRSQNHLVGNHTFSHPGLVAFTQQGGDPVEEVSRTDALIHADSPAPITFLRAPYGNWRETVAPQGPDRPSSLVAERLNRAPLARRYVGPVNWDISRQDFDCWRLNRSVEDCVTGYLERIRERGQGIVLMHDSSDDDAIRQNNQTYWLTMRIVPILKAEGYQFVRLDEIPQVQSAMRVTAVVALRSSNGRYLGLSADGRRLVADAPSVAFGEQFGLTELGADRVALRATDGLYLSAPAGRNASVIPGATSLGEAETFALEPRGADQLAVRTWTGQYVWLDPHNGAVRSDAAAPHAEMFHRVGLFDPAPAALRPDGAS